MTQFKFFEANGRKYSAWVKDGKVCVQNVGSMETSTLRVRAGAWDDVMNSCFYDELVYVDRFIVCLDKSGELFARNNYNY